LKSEIFVSYIIPTVGRRTLDIAVQSVLNQEFSHADFEVIVVNDSGSPLYKAAWHASPRVRMINTNKCERCFARNSGAAIAKGKYLAFLDDDDWILPGALNCFWQLANQFPNASWLYGGIQIMDEQHRPLAELNSNLNGNCFAHIMSGVWAPIQASLVQSRAFFQVGGFDPAISVTEDEDLCRRISYYGDFANTIETVACLFRGQSWNTTSKYRRAPSDVKYSRDLILAKPEAFYRLRMSADSSYVWGRILRVYGSTITWNLKKKRYFVALSRLLYSFAILGFSITYLFSHEYWEALRADHVPNTLHFVMKVYEQKSNCQQENTKQDSSHAR
jgi:glycosyltransferase involved in cell wall biosynthesis